LLQGSYSVEISNVDLDKLHFLLLLGIWTQCGHNNRFHVQTLAG
jgi:hypothetical protein